MWTLLCTVTDWEKHQKDTMLSLGISGLSVLWGKGPKEYPCLVSTCLPTNAISPLKLLSAYVFVSDARALIAAIDDEQAVKKSFIGPRTEKITQALPNQDNFNRWVSAYLLALVRELREIGAIKAELFENSLAESLQLIDEVTTEKKDAIMKGLDKIDKSIIDRLLGTEE